MEVELFHSYTLPRKFKDMNIPINIQSCFLRDYCAKRNFKYVLPQTELINNDSRWILKTLLGEISNHRSVIGMASIFMLPYYEPERIEALRVLDEADNLEWHFPLEAAICRTSELRILINEYLFLESLSRKTLREHLCSFET